MTDLIKVEVRGRVAICTLNRPHVLNALSSDVLKDLVEKLFPLDSNSSIGCFILTGSEKAFAAGADIKEMQDQPYSEMARIDWFSGWQSFASLRTPVIAAVSGFALGGGCELAMMCDFIIASETAKFGQPEIRLGVIPGMGGSQRLTRAVGKSKATDMILTGRMMDAAEAERAGLVSRIVPSERLLDEAIAAAEEIAGFSKPTVLVAKEAIGRAFESSLAEGLLFERRTFHALFSTEDQKEGMRAFSEKRKPNFRGC